MPYGAENFSRSVKGMVEYLKSGQRLSCPPVAYGPILYEINVLIMCTLISIVNICSYPMMMSCWVANSDDRPSFSELVVMFESQLSTLLSQETSEL